ncbi:MAG: hypothetical protein VX252_17125 [Myxococcota bacterium]|nr:hypothetical protein [Myxococcota bacterium]
MKTFIAILAGCSLSFVVGLVAGRLTAPSSDSGLALEQAKAGMRTSPLAPADDSEADAALAESGQNSKLDFLESMQDDPRVVLARKLASWTDDPAAVVGTVIDGMNPDEISMIVSSLTSLNKEELENVEDLPRYAKRLAELALNDVSNEPNYYDPDLRPVYFSLEPDPELAVEAQQERFNAGNSRMHAIFPMEGYQQDSVFVKWTDEAGEVMLFDRYPIRESEEHNWVYLEPKEGWQKGNYTVSFLSDDEQMSLLGTGGYRVE